MNRIFTTWKFTLNVCLPAPHPHPYHLKKETTKIWASGPGIISNKSTFGLDGVRWLRLGEGSIATAGKRLVSGQSTAELSAFMKASENLHVTVL